MRGFSGLIFLLACRMYAQSQTGELRISVIDQTGAPVQAVAEVLGDSTSPRQSVTVHSDGTYAFRNLPFGVYRLSVTRSGFATASERVEVRSAVPLLREIRLGVEAVETTVSITEHDTLIDPERTNAAAYVGAQTLKERPAGTPGRGVLNLVGMQPGWTFESNGILHPRESEYDTQFV